MTLYNPKYTYKSIKRTNTDLGRFYRTPDGQSVASVTTILDQTKSEEKKQKLQEWRTRVGHAKATAITTEAAGRGTSMHKQLENWLECGDLKTGGNLVHQTSAKMAQIIIDYFLKPNLNEYWGFETGLYYSGLYAGTTDLVGVYQNKESILDFKQTNRPKKTEWIEDYFLQTVAYAHAHNHIFGTNIEQCVVLMCSKDLMPQSWIIKTDDFEKYSNLWWDRVDKFYKK